MLFVNVLCTLGDGEGKGWEGAGEVGRMEDWRGSGLRWKGGRGGEIMGEEGSSGEEMTAVGRGGEEWGGEEWGGDEWRGVVGPLLHTSVSGPTMKGLQPADPGQWEGALGCC